MRCVALAVVVLWVFAAPRAFASGDSESGLADLLEGFDEPEEEEPSSDPSLRLLDQWPDDGEEADTAAKPREAATGQRSDVIAFDAVSGGAIARLFGAGRERVSDLGMLSGELELATSYRFDTDRRSPVMSDYGSLSRARLGGRLALSASPFARTKIRISGRAFRDYAYAVKGRENFTREVLDADQSDADLQDAYVLVSLVPGLDLKVGRQLIVWGALDDFRVVDVFNPLDLREPGLVDLKDLRLQVAATRLDYYIGPLQATAVAIHESRLPDLPDFGGDFFPADRRPPPEERPANGGSETEFGGRLFGSFSGVDLAVQFARYNDDETYFDPRVGFLKHARLSMAGASGVFTTGDFVFRGDAAQVSGLRFAALPGESFSRTDVGLGFDYSGFKNTTLSVEVVLRRLHDFAQEIEGPIDATRRSDLSASVRLRRTFLNERVVVTVLFRGFGGSFEDGSVVRADLSYVLRDSVTLNVGALIFNGGELAPLSRFARNDRAFVTLRYAF